MNVHVKFALLVVGIIALAVLVLILRADAVLLKKSTLTMDIFLGVLGAALAGMVISYVVTLTRRAPGSAAGEDPSGEQVVPARGLERLLGRTPGRVMSGVVLALVGAVVLFLVVFLGYLLYLYLFMGMR